MTVTVAEEKEGKAGARRVGWIGTDGEHMVMDGRWVSEQIEVR